MKIAQTTSGQLLNKQCRTCDKLLIVDVNCTSKAITSYRYLCNSCRSLKDKEYRRRFLEKKKRDVPDYQKNRSQQYRERNPQTVLRWQLSQFGLTYEKYQSLVDHQNGVCAICSKPPSGSKLDKRLCVDHCHITSRVRGLLCRACNGAVGQLGDTAESLLKVVEYLR